MDGVSAARKRRAALSDAVAQAFGTMPERYLGGERGEDATFHIRLADLGRVWELRLRERSAHVRVGPSRKPHVRITTDAETWLALREGRLSGVDAYRRRRLALRGELDLAVGLEGRFRLPNGRPPLLRLRAVDAGGLQISTLTMGSGPDVLLLHGLGATKASFYDTAAALSHDHRVHLLDLPGFGGSSKPLGASYTPDFHARAALAVMDALGIERAHLVGNSMGGRVALELALTRPERVIGLALLSPATAFLRRDLWPLVRLARPEFGLFPHAFGSERIRRTFIGLFADPDVIDPEVADVVVDEFERIYRTAGARLAFLSSARNLYLERPFGRDGFFPRLAGLERPALFVWGSHDQLIPASFQRHVEQWLPGADHVLLHGCGHVPQVEMPERTIGLIRRFFDRVEPLRAVGQLPSSHAA